MDDLQMNNLTNVLDKYIKKGMVNHAYLIETNSDNRLDVGNALIEKIIGYDNNTSINEMYLNDDIVLLSTEQATIKKEEINNLKDKFLTKSTQNNKRIYIIEEAEKLNNSSANTLLKFLEEPEENIIGILLTKNVNLVINTIVSRCQIIRYFENKSDNEEFDQLDFCFKFIDILEQHKLKSIAYINKILTKEMLDRKLLQNLLIELQEIYGEILHYKMSSNNKYSNYVDYLEKFAKINELKILQQKINAINECLERLKYNANGRMLIDKLIILMFRSDNND